MMTTMVLMIISSYLVHGSKSTTDWTLMNLILIQIDGCFNSEDDDDDGDSIPDTQDACPIG